MLASIYGSKILFLVSIIFFSKSDLCLEILTSNYKLGILFRKSHYSIFPFSLYLVTQSLRVLIFPIFTAVVVLQYLLSGSDGRKSSNFWLSSFSWTTLATFSPLGKSLFSFSTHLHSGLHSVSAMSSRRSICSICVHGVP